MSQYDVAHMYDATPKQHQSSQFMRKLSNTGADLKKSVAYKEACIGQNAYCDLLLASL